MRPALWTHHRFLIVIAAGCMVLGTYTAALQSVEDRAYELAARLLPPAPDSAAVAVLAIDTATLARMGPWPWPHDLLAGIVTRLQDVHPRAVGLLLPLAGSQTPPGLAQLRADAQTMNSAGAREVRAWLAHADPDTVLAQALAETRNVILAAYGHTTSETRPLPGALQSAVVTARDLLPPPYPTLLRPFLAPPGTPPQVVRAPLESLMRGAAGVGLVHTQQRRARGAALLPRVDGQRLPSFALRLAAQAVEMPMGAVVPMPGRGIQIGQLMRRTGPGYRWYPQPPRDTRGGLAVPVYSLARWWAGEVPASRLRQRIVLVGLTAPDQMTPFPGVGGLRYTPVTWNAAVVDSLLNGTGITVPTWFFGAQRALILLLALWLLLLPSAMHGRRGLWLSGALALLLLNAEVLALVTHLLWLPLTLPAVFLVTTQMVLAVGHRMRGIVAAAHAATAQAQRALSGHLQTQGRLDEAFEILCRCPLDAAVVESLYSLGQEFERRRQFPKAMAVYARIARHDAAYRDIRERHGRLASVAEHFPSAAGAGAGVGLGATKTLVMNDPRVEKPMLGRYRLERELGKGTMGMVYLGADPKIGRPVAIKTLALSQEFEGSALQAAEQRFLQEAQAAGRLDHPNIVTIYDVGEEHDVAYIAMDYVEGENLESFTAPDRRLPVGEVLDVGAQVADALDYAHHRGVVHRDIKPGNILYPCDGGNIKVTDFGIASLTDSHHTRTGTLLGSPSYMSPEQVAGDRVDGATDLYSLGVTLYQLLTAQLPFTGDSLATLMYRIAHQRHVDIRKQRRGLPACVGRVINTALQKDPKKRYSDGAAMAAALRKCRQQVKGGRRRGPN
ncbi:MAG: CHASE2 domain-containing serine/threonine-protein kinase [Gammaproteobacteria bacterium]